MVGLWGGMLWSVSLWTYLILQGSRSLIIAVKKSLFFPPVQSLMACATAHPSRTSAANTSRSPNIGLMLSQRRRRWLNISPTLGERLVLADHTDAGPVQWTPSLYWDSIGPACRTGWSRDAEPGGCERWEVGLSSSNPLHLANQLQSYQVPGTWKWESHAGFFQGHFFLTYG